MFTSLIFMRRLSCGLCGNDLFAFVDRDQQGHEAGQIALRFRRRLRGDGLTVTVLFKRLSENVYAHKSFPIR